jgi:hypothetical protein
MCSSVCSRSLPKGITFDLSGRVTNIKAQNIQQHNLSADGLIIVKVK